MLLKTVWTTRTARNEFFPHSDKTSTNIKISTDVFRGPPQFPGISNPSKKSDLSSKKQKKIWQTFLAFDDRWTPLDSPLPRCPQPRMNTSRLSFLRYFPLPRSSSSSCFPQHGGGGGILTNKFEWFISDGFSFPSRKNPDLFFDTLEEEKILRLFPRWWIGPRKISPSSFSASFAAQRENPLRSKETTVAKKTLFPGSQGSSELLFFIHARPSERASNRVPSAVVERQIRPRDHRSVGGFLRRSVAPLIRHDDVLPTMKSKHSRRDCFFESLSWGRFLLLRSDHKHLRRIKISIRVWSNPTFFIPDLSRSVRRIRTLIRRRQQAEPETQSQVGDCLWEAKKLV